MSGTGLNSGGSGGLGGGAGNAGIAGSVGVGGSNNGGTSAMGGISSCGRSAADPRSALPCAPVAVQTPFITDFADWNDVEGRWGGDPNVHVLTGGVYIYNGSGVGVLSGQVSPANRSWTVSGSVLSYAGFGLWFDVRRPFEGHCPYNCLDAFAGGCEGVRFTLRASMTAPVPVLDVVLDIWDNRPNNLDLPGGCLYSSEQTMYTDCVQPFVQIATSPEPVEYRLSFDDFTAGKPLLNGTGEQLVGIHFALPWVEGMPPFDVAVTVSDFAFVGGTTCVPPTRQ